MKTNPTNLDEETTFTLLNDAGDEIPCERLLTFEDDTTGKTYVLYTDNTTDATGGLRVYASQLETDGITSRLLPVTEERIWTVAEQILAALEEENAFGDQAEDLLWEETDSDDKTEAQLQAELARAANELSVLLPQHKQILDALAKDAQSVPAADLDAVLQDLDALIEAE